MDIHSPLKKLPSVESVLEDGRVAERISLLARGGITRIIRDTIETYRRRIRAEELKEGDSEDLKERIVADVVGEIDSVETASLRRVINATGVILHTNLGRAVLGAGTMAAMRVAAEGYVDLEMDLRSGRRVGRERRVRRLLSLITGVEDALVVNNNAAAVLLAVATLAGRGSVAVSRGELVEIGGSFRLPDILASVAGRVLEVGTTNRTHLKDYEDAIRDGATLLLKVHTSNYRIMGYTNEVPLAELAELGRSHRIPVMYDQGSGILYPLETEGITGEDSIGSCIASGVDLISFSADKVLGAPQGGILLGTSELIGRMRDNHLSRALRVDKLALAGLEHVLLRYWRGEFGEIPVLGMITAPLEAIGERARRFISSVGAPASGVSIRATEGESSIGGGSFPINPLRTVLVEIHLRPGRAERLSTALRGGDPAVLVRVKGDSIYIDLRSVAESEEQSLRQRLEETLGSVLERE